MEKEYLYVGHYTDTEGNYILKIGTTNDLHRRQLEHNRTYKNSSNHTLSPDSRFEYLWHTKLSKYNTARYEDLNRELWKQAGVGEFVRNDRFVLRNPPSFVEVKIRKTYNVPLGI